MPNPNNQNNNVDKNKEQSLEITSEEIGGYKGPEPTKYGDWQQKGRVSDF